MGRVCWAMVVFTQNTLVLYASFIFWFYKRGLLFALVESVFSMFPKKMSYCRLSSLSLSTSQHFLPLLTVVFTILFVTILTDKTVHNLLPHWLIRLLMLSQHWLIRFHKLLKHWLIRLPTSWHNTDWFVITLTDNTSQADTTLTDRKLTQQWLRRLHRQTQHWLIRLIASWHNTDWLRLYKLPKHWLIGLLIIWQNTEWKDCSQAGTTLTDKTYW